MASFGVDTRPAAAAATGEGALSFLSRSLRSEMPMRRHYAALLRRAAALPSLQLVASLHAAALRRGAVLVPSLIHAYSACGDPASARSLFDGLPAQDRTLSARTALASAISAHGGRCREVLELFRGREGEMDDKAVTVVLAACARAGMVDEGRRVFARVRRPALQHYTCMVEMLGRAGEVEEAEGLVTRMEACPDRVICAVLLATCRVHGRVEVAERVARLMRGMMLVQNQSGSLNSKSSSRRLPHKAYWRRYKFPDFML